MIRRFKAHARKFITPLLKESLDPCRAAAAVFLGIFIGIMPIYGLQTLAAVGVALLFRLNKPLTIAGTFVNNPMLQPLIVVSSVELGCLLRVGSFQPLISALAAARTHLNKEQFLHLGDWQRGTGYPSRRRWGRRLLRLWSIFISRRLPIWRCGSASAL